MHAYDYGELPASQRIKQPALVIIKSTDFWAGLEPLRGLLHHLNEGLRNVWEWQIPLRACIILVDGGFGPLDCKKSRIPKRHSGFLRTVPLRNVTNIKLMPYMSLHTTSFLNTARKVSQQTLRVNYISPLKPTIRQYSSNSRVSGLRNLHLSTDDGTRIPIILHFCQFSRMWKRFFNSKSHPHDIQKCTTFRTNQ